MQQANLYQSKLTTCFCHYLLCSGMILHSQNLLLQCYLFLPISSCLPSLNPSLVNLSLAVDRMFEMRFNCLPHNPDFFTTLTKKPLENIVGKRENFLLFPQSFLPHQSEKSGTLNLMSAKA